MNSTIKTELISFAHTFFAVFVVTGLPMLISFNWQTADKAALSALAVAILRSMVKALIEKLSTPVTPQLSTDNLG